MKLKKIEIIGFKSFADRTVFKFDLGLTAIVGPNGCGKSNVADAFRWVLGEQSARSLRGNKMPDVIFAGTTQRKAQNFAEVTITLTEVAGKLPVAYDEVSVTRRLHRSGESEYFINKQPVRLKDVQELLLDSGIGNDAYAIFEQGKIDEVIKLPPLERRYIFEEAAGIKRFLQKKKEALRKLEQTKGNVDRVRDLHGEIERQVVILEKQAEEAKDYKNKKAKLEEFEKTLLAEKWFDWERRKKALEQKISAADASIAETTEKSDVLQGQIHYVKALLVEAEKNLRDHSETVFRLRSSKEIHSRERENCIARLEELQQKGERWARELQQIQQRRIAWQTEKDGIAALLKKLDSQQQQYDKELQKHRLDANVTEEGLKKQRSELQLKQKGLVEAMQSLQGVQGEGKQLEIRIENAREREKYLHSRKQQLHEQKKTVEQQAKECQSTFDTLLGNVEEKRGALASLEVHLSDNVAQLDDIEGQLEKVVKELTDAKARYKALKSLQDEMEGFSSGTQQLMHESASPKSPIHKKLEALYPHFVAKKGAEKAIAAVMAMYGQTLVVPTNDDFHLVVDFAKKKGIADFSLVCLETIAKTTAKKSRTPKGTKQLVEYVDENPVAHHFLSQISLPQPNADVEPSEGPAVRFDGVYTDQYSVTFFPKVDGGSVFLRDSELKELDKSIVSMEKDRAQLEQVVRSMQQKRKELQADILLTDKAIRQLEIKSAEVNVALQKYGVDKARIEAEARKAAEEVDATAELLKTFISTQESCSGKLEKAKESVVLAQQSVDVASTKFEEMTADAKQQLAALRHIESTWQGNLDERRKQANLLNVIEGKESESQQQQKRIEEELEAGRNLITQLLLKKEELIAILLHDDKALAEGLKARGAVEEVVGKRQQEITSLQSKVDAHGKELRKLQEQRHQVHVQMAQTDIQMQSLANELQQRHSVDTSSLTPTPHENAKSMDQLEAHVKQLRLQLETTAAINMTSIEEYERCQVRHKEISIQLEDMGMAEKELLDIIADLDSESRQLFKETFAKVRENFQKNFSILFTGGEADLQFVDSGDILEAGVEIVAKPPGKQMRSINLLSGGEKCLTALALLFAIFEVKPSPFCILDEIDAPLDDSNVDRFVNIVKKFSEVCQFIVITHNKRTMAIADRIFGVSMEERGVSKLLTIDLATRHEEELNKQPELTSIY